MEFFNTQNCRKGFLFDLAVAFFIISKWSWWKSNSLPFWVAPDPSELASIFKQVYRLGLKFFGHGVVVTRNFSFLIASSWGFSSLNSTSLFSRVWSGEVTSVRFCMKFSLLLLFTQYFEEPSSFEKKKALAICGNISSAVGSWRCSHHIALFNSNLGGFSRVSFWGGGGKWGG